MAFEMIDRDQRLARRERQTFSREQRDHHAADQAGARSRRDRIDVARRQLRLAQHAFDQVRQNLDMGARRDLRNHAAIGLVRLRLADDRLRENAPVARHQRRGAVVAAPLKAENDAHFVSGPLPHRPPLH
jgi:hypothetical protein